MYSQKIYLIFIDLTLFTFCFFKLELERKKKKKKTLTAQCWLFLKADLFCFLFSYVLYLSNTQTVQAQTIGIHGEGCKQWGDFGLMQYHMPRGCYRCQPPSSWVGTPWWPLEGDDGVQEPRQRQKPWLFAFHWLVDVGWKQKVEKCFWLPTWVSLD